VEILSGAVLLLLLYARVGAASPEIWGRIVGFLHRRRTIHARTDAIEKRRVVWRTQAGEDRASGLGCRFEMCSGEPGPIGGSSGGGGGGGGEVDRAHKSVWGFPDG